MAEYRCYFFGPGNAIEAAEAFEAETDGEARARGEALYERRSNRIHGFEVWQQARLVSPRRT